MLGLIQAQEGSYASLHFLCACVDSSENSTTLLGMPTHLDRSSFTGPGLTHADLSLCSGIDWSLASSFANLSIELLFQLSSRVPLPTFGHAEISSPKPFVWFCAKTDKGIICLADHLHSVTSPCGVMAKVLDCSLEVSSFKLHLYNYVHFWINTFGKGMKTPYSPPSHEVNSITAVPCPVDWGCRIHQLHDTKQSDSEAPVMVEL